MPFTYLGLHFIHEPIGGMAIGVNTTYTYSAIWGGSLMICALGVNS